MISRNLQIHIGVVHYVNDSQALSTYSLIAQMWQVSFSTIVSVQWVDLKHFCGLYFLQPTDQSTLRHQFRYYIKWHPGIHLRICLKFTHPVLKPLYLQISRTNMLLLLSRLLVSPGRQELWHWICLTCPILKRRISTACQSWVMIVLRIIIYLIIPQWMILCFYQATTNRKLWAYAGFDIVLKDLLAHWTYTFAIDWNNHVKKISDIVDIYDWL